MHVFWIAVVVTMGALYVLGASFAAWRVLRARPLRNDTARVGRQTLAVSVLKPMCGLDPGIEENLESFAALAAAPSFEVIMVIADPKDPAVRLAARFVGEYPRTFRLVLGADRHKNPKVALLTRALRRARNELVWVSDSNTRASQAQLECLVATYQAERARTRRPTLIHAPLVAIGGRGLGAALERIHLSSFANANHELTRVGLRHAVIGKSLLTTSSDLHAIGGFEAVADFLAEDFMLGEMFRKRGGHVRRIGVATKNVLGTLDLGTWLARHQRWAVMRKNIAPGAYLSLEILTYPSAAIPLAALGLVPWSLVALLHAIKATGDSVLFRVHAGVWPRPVDLAVAPMKEALLLYIWLSSALTNHVVWRGRALGLGWQSRIVTEDAPASRAVRHWRRVQHGVRWLSPARAVRLVARRKRLHAAPAKPPSVVH